MVAITLCFTDSSTGELRGVGASSPVIFSARMSNTKDVVLYTLNNGTTDPT